MDIVILLNDLAFSGTKLRKRYQSNEMKKAGNGFCYFYVFIFL